MKWIFSRVFEQQIALREPGAYTFVFEEGSSGFLYVLIEEQASDVSLQLEAHKNSAVRVWFDVRAAKGLTLRQKISCAQAADVQVSFLDLEAGEAAYDIRGVYEDSGGRIALSTAVLASADKRWRMEIVHDHPHTQGLMENYCVVEDDARCKIEAIGNIKKGAYASESHQKTRVLTMSEHHNAEVLPLLYIDENDVKASHAMTLGQPNADQLYYLQTRGLSKRAALGLLSIGYFLPIVERIENSELQAQIKCRVEEKVGLYGHREHS